MYASLMTNYLVSIYHTYLNKLTPFPQGGRQKLQNANCYVHIHTPDHTRTPVVSWYYALQIKPKVPLENHFFLNKK